MLTDGLLDQLADLLGDVEGQSAVSTLGRHAPTGIEPWHREAAGAYWRIHFGARRLEHVMRRVTGLPKRPRGGSHDNTVAALRAVSALATTVPALILTRAADAVERWVTSARAIHDVDEAETWVPVPRVPGVLPPACPYCHNLSLRMARARGEVRCFTEGCTDAAGRPVRARMERGRLTGDGVLVFGDTTVVHFRAESPTDSHCEP